MRKQRVLPAAVAAFALLLAACGGDEAEDTATESSDATDDATDDADDATDEPADDAQDDASAEGEEINLEVSTASVPDDPHTQAMYEFAELVEERSNGRITATIHDSGSLMDQNTEQTAIVSGDVDIVYTAAPWVVDQIPQLGALFVPFLFEDHEHLFRVHDGEIGAQIRQTVVDELGIRPLTTVFKGSRELNLTDNVGRVMTPEDLAGVNLRVPDADAWIEMGRALGADPTPIAFGELYLALQTGTVDGQDNPLITTWNADFYEVTSQIVLTTHIIDEVWPTINEELWQSLDAEAQEIIQQAWIDAREVSTNITLDQDAELRANLEDAGLEVYEPDREAFRDHALAYYLEDESLSGQWQDGLFESIQDLANG